MIRFFKYFGFSSISLGTPTTHSSLGGKVSIKTSDSGNQSSTVFTVIGTDMAGNVIQESISGSTSGNTSIGSKVFKLLQVLHQVQLWEQDL